MNWNHLTDAKATAIFSKELCSETSDSKGWWLIVKKNYCVVLLGIEYQVLLSLWAVEYVCVGEKELSSCNCNLSHQWGDVIKILTMY